MNADDALRLWVHVLGGGAQLHTVALTDSQDVCSRPGPEGICGGTMTIRGRRPREQYVCASCGLPWQPISVALVDPNLRRKKSAVTARPRTKTPRMRRDSLLPLEQDADAYGRLSRAFVPRPNHEPAGTRISMSQAEWAFCLLALWLCVDGKGMSPMRAATVGAERFPGAEAGSWWWSERKVREACRVARMVVEYRLRRGVRYERDDAGRARRKAASNNGRALGLPGGRELVRVR